MCECDERIGRIEVTLKATVVCFECPEGQKNTPVDAILGAAKQMHTVISAECTGCELCVSSCPDVFEMADDVAVVKGDVVPDGMENDVKQAVEDCPVEAIKIEE